jgi:hypothetical protein
MSGSQAGLDETRDLYEADAAVMRPDQMLTRRGRHRSNALQVVERARGNAGKFISVTLTLQS